MAEQPAVSPPDDADAGEPGFEAFRAKLVAHFKYMKDNRLVSVA